MLQLKVTPGSSRQRLAVDGTLLRLHLTARPIEGQANRQLIRALAKTFGVPARDVEIQRGERGRDKTVAIHDPARLPDCLVGLVDAI